MVLIFMARSASAFESVSFLHQSGRSFERP
jgi:hypothetical protein